MVHMAQRLFFFVFLLRGILTFYQNDYTMVFHRVDLESFNPHYFSNVSIRTYKYNRTQPAINVTVTMNYDYGYQIGAILQAYTFLSNEFRIFPIRYGFNFCEGLEKNDFGLGEFYTHGKFPRCPMKKGKYYFNNWKPDASKFPPFIPDGEYKLRGEVVIAGEQRILFNAYGEVKREILYKPPKPKTVG